MSVIKVSDYPQTVLVAGAVLVIDDDAAIRHALTNLLGLLTLAAVYTATNGPEGLRILQQRQNIVLVLLEMNLPVMNGKETYKKVQEIAPEAKVIVSSHLSPTEVRFRLGERQPPPFLQKPFDVTTLLTVVHSVAAAGTS